MPGTRSDRSDFCSKQSGITIDEAAERKRIWKDGKITRGISRG